MNSSATLPSLESWLTGTGPAPPLDVLRAAHLGGYAYTTLHEADPVREQLRADFLEALTRHHAIRRELVPLIAAWHDAGIDTLLFKGFYMAEFVYPVPGTRFHGDVDLAVPRGMEARALRIALDRGWSEQGNTITAGQSWSHCAFNIEQRDGATRVDGHRYVIHKRLPGTRVQRRITAAVWERAQRQTIDGVPCLVPDPTDALLVLALQRCWGDAWRLKMHDALDIRAVHDRFGVGAAELRVRARELGCERTVDIFLDMCDPDSGRLELEPAGRGTTARRHLAVLPEHPLLAFDRQLARAVYAPAVLHDVLRVLPLVLRTIRHVRRHREIDALLDAVTPRDLARSPGTIDERRRTVRGVRWCVRLLRVRAGGPCLVRSLAVFTALRAAGWPVVFVSGVRRTEDGNIIGHAWVELDGLVLPELKEPASRTMFSVNVRHP